MLRIILLAVISTSCTNVFADSFFVKYNDLVKSIVITEEFRDIDDFSNRLEELNYINEQSIKILNWGNSKNIHTKNLNASSVRIGGEGGGT